MDRRNFLRTTGALGLGGLVSADAMRVLASDPEAAGITVHEFSGTPLEIGRAHGEALRPQIQEFVGMWKLFLGQEIGMPIDQFVEAFLAETHFMAAMKKWTPELLEEIEGIAEGSGVDLPTLQAFNFTDEQTWWARDKALGMLPPPDHCTSMGFASRGSQPTVIAQNMDIPSATEGFEFLMKLNDPKTGHRQMVFNLAGMIGLCGMNNAPVAVVNNSLKQLNTNIKGLPVNVVTRGVLARRSFNAASKFVGQVPHASGQNYVIGDRKQVGSFECSGGKVVEFRPETKREGAVYHTNHPLVNDDTATWEALKKKLPDEKIYDESSSRARWKVLVEKVESSDEPGSVELAQSILTSRDNDGLPICRPRSLENPGKSFTAGSLVMELSNRPKLRIAAGPPSETPYESFMFLYG